MSRDLFDDLIPNRTARILMLGCGNSTLSPSMHTAANDQAIMFVSSDEDAEVLKQIQSRFEVAVPELPETIEASSYMNA